MPSPKHKHGWSGPYRAAQLARHEMKETNDCTVIALSFATGRSYKEAHDIMARNGRVPGNGMYRHEWMKVFEDMGFTMKQVDIREIISQFPGRHVLMKNLTTYHPRRFPEVFTKMKGTYLFLMRRHVACMVDGEVHDWSAGKLNRVESVYKIEPK